MTPKRLFRIVAVAEAVTWGLLGLGMWLKYGPVGTGLGVAVAGSLHGTAFLAYLFVVLVVGADRRWRIGEVLLGAAASVAPFATVIFSAETERRGRLDGDWRSAEHEPGDGRGDGCAASVGEAAAPPAPEPPPTLASRLAGLPGWSRRHPLTLAASAALVTAMTLTGALARLGA